MYKPGHYYVVPAAKKPPLGPFQTVAAAVAAGKNTTGMIVQAIMPLSNSGAQPVDKASAPAGAAIGQTAG